MTATESDRLPQRFELAFALQQRGMANEAFAGYATVLEIDPDHAPALHYSALLLMQNGRLDEAVVRIERSLALDASVPDTWVNAGMIYGAAGRGADAARALERAVEIEPTLSEAWIALSAQRMEMDEPVAAEAAARKALALAPAPVLLAPAASTQWRPTAAIGAWFHLALALAAQRRSGEALDALDRLERSIPVGEALNPAIPGIRAQVLIAAGRPQLARRVLDLALARVDDAALRLERARLGEAAGDLEASLADYDAVLRPDVADTLYETALSDAIFLRKRLFAWDGLPALQKQFRQRVARHRYAGDASMLTPFSFLSDPSTRIEQRVAAEACARRYRVDPLPQRKLAGGRLRIGYLSADLHRHATGILAVGLFEQHDRDHFEVFAYSTGPDDGSALRARIVAAFDHFVDARDWPEAALAQRIAADGIDILVDLKGHTERAPTAVMALRPAPIAVSYLGYPGTMGAPFVDYLIGDRVVTPLAHAGDYSETLVQLPHSYQVNDDRREIADAPPRATLGLPDDAVVLCCFNGLYKINADVLDAWVEILARAPNTVVWLQTRGDATDVRERFLREIASRSDGRVAPGRIVFADTRSHAEYLALYRRADLFLDTWPYNAHTTASDALWAGCPVLTIAGETFAGRVAASLLTALGATQGIVPDRANYIATAVALAADPARLAGMRARIEASGRSSPLFDTKRTTRAIEAAYRAMARQFASGARRAILVNSDLTVTD